MIIAEIHPNLSKFDKYADLCTLSTIISGMKNGLGKKCGRYSGCVS